MKFKNLVALCVAITATGVSAQDRVTLQTNRGNIDINLPYGLDAPLATKNFYELCKRGYYDKTQFFRLTTQGLYVVQGGDPTATGTGGESIYGKGFGYEKTNGQYTKGAVATANAGPDTNGSQFFIIYRDSLPLPPMYTVFGQVTSGMDIIEEVAVAGDDGGSGEGDGSPVMRFIII
ncbi:hypothetical protein BGZ97_008631, partial [Linnemannia gamsii]